MGDARHAQPYLVVLRAAVHPFERIVHPAGRFLVHFQIGSHKLGQRLPGNIVQRRTEASGDHHHVWTERKREAERRDDLIDIVSNDRHAGDAASVTAHPLDHRPGVRIDAPAQQLVAHVNEGYGHADISLRRKRRYASPIVARIQTIITATAVMTGGVWM